MAYEKIIRPTRVALDSILDMRNSTELGDDLKRQIAESVDHTQKFVIQDLPNRLHLTFKQFASMVQPEDTERLTDHIWVTPSNVMDVDIDASDVPMESHPGSGILIA